MPALKFVEARITVAGEVTLHYTCVAWHRLGTDCLNSPAGPRADFLEPVRVEIDVRFHFGCAGAPTSSRFQPRARLSRTATSSRQGAIIGAHLGSNIQLRNLAGLASCIDRRALIQYDYAGRLATFISLASTVAALCLTKSGVGAFPPESSSSSA